MKAILINIGVYFQIFLILIEHLLLGLLRDGGGKAISILNSLEIDLNYLRKKVEILSPPNPINDFNQNHKKNLHQLINIYNFQNQ